MKMTIQWYVHLRALGYRITYLCTFYAWWRYTYIFALGLYIFRIPVAFSLYNAWIVKSLTPGRHWCHNIDTDYNQSLISE